MEGIFTKIYEKKIWGDNKNKNYSGSSGGGSCTSYNKKYVEILKKVISDYNITSVVDLGCGDGRWLIAVASLTKYRCTCIG